MGRPLLSIAAVALVALAGCRPRVDVDALVRRRGPDGAAEVLRDRLARDPRDRAAWVALATVEIQRQRPGAALDAFTRAETLGAPVVAALDGEERAALATLLITRARGRAARGSPGADTDLARARRLGGQVDASLARDAALAAIVAELRHSDPVRRAHGAARLRTVDAELAAGLDGGLDGRPDGGPDGHATDAQVAATAAWLIAGGARRVGFEILDRRVEERLASGARPSWTRADVARWLELRRWWSGTLAPVDVPSLDAAFATGVATCAYAIGPVDRRCDVIAAAASTAPEGAPWESALVAVWEREGWVAPDGDRALAWMIVAARAARRGQLVSWERAVADHVPLAALVDDPGTPGWARSLARAIAAGAPLPEVAAPPAVAALLAERAAAIAPVAPAAAIAAIARSSDADAALVSAAEISDLVRAYGRDPALADRAAEDLAAGAIDLAELAPIVGRAFAALGDPARARAWWQRGFDASDDEPALALGLALAMVAAGDSPAALQLVVRAAASSGDAAATLVRAARGFAAHGATLDALGLARQAIELSAPGDEDRAAGLAAELLRALGRRADEVAALAAVPAAGSLDDARREVARVAALPDPAQAAAQLVALARRDDPALAQLALARWQSLALVAARRSR